MAHFLLFTVIFSWEEEPGDLVDSIKISEEFASPFFQPEYGNLNLIPVDDHQSAGDTCNLHLSSSIWANASCSFEM